MKATLSPFSFNFFIHFAASQLLRKHEWLEDYSIYYLGVDLILGTHPHHISKSRRNNRLGYPEFYQGFLANQVKRAQKYLLNQLPPEKMLKFQDLALF